MRPPVAAAEAAPPAVVRQIVKLVLHQPDDRELGPEQTDAFTVDVTAGSVEGDDPL